MTNEDSGSPVWTPSYWMQTTEDVARAVAAAAAAATDRSHRPSIIFSTKDENSDGQFQKIQRHVAKVLKGLSTPSAERKGGNYNPEVLTSQKRQWANVHMHMDQKLVKEPSRLYESIVVVGLSPYCDIKELQKQMLEKNLDSSKTLKFAPNSQNCVSLEPQVLFVYPPEKQLPLKYKDLLSFCFPAGVEVHAVEKTPSLSALNEILLGQEHLNQSNLCFVFRLKVADDSTLYGCCALVEEIVEKPSGLISMLADRKPRSLSLCRFQMTTPRCYCILSRLPFFDLHFGVLKNIFAEEKFQRLKNGMAMLELPASNQKQDEDNEEASSDLSQPIDSEKGIFIEPFGSCNGGGDSTSCSVVEDNCVGSPFSSGMAADKINSSFGESEVEDPEMSEESVLSVKICNDHVKQINDKRLPEAILPMLRYHQYESSESSSSVQGSPCADENFRSHVEESELEEASSSGCDESSDYDEILEWAKANNHGSLQIICEYYRMHCPSRSSTINFHPLEHLHPVKFQRPAETVLYTAGSTIDLRSCSTSLEVADAHSALLAEEEATALSVWTVACLCGNLRLEHVLMIFAGALLEKQIVFICSNLGVLSALVLSVIPLIRPYQWQSLLMPVLPNDMLDFLDAPVPFVVGVKDKSAEVQSKLSNVILVDANKNQLKTASIPQLPQHKELLATLSPYHARLVGESYLAKRRPVHECTDIQVEAAKGFLAVLRSYLDSLCSNLRSHTITNVQSNDDKVSLLLKESFIDSFPSRDRPFMKLFVDTQLFSVHTDLVLSFYQKE